MQVEANVGHSVDRVRFPESQSVRQVEATQSRIEREAPGQERVEAASGSEEQRSDPGPHAGQNVDISA